MLKKKFMEYLYRNVVTGKAKRNFVQESGYMYKAGKGFSGVYENPNISSMLRSTKLPDNKKLLQALNNKL